MKLVKRFVSVVLALLIVAALSVTAYASNVNYDDVSEKFVFSATGGENPTDLFEDFKLAVPGDELTQEIVLKNLETNRMDVKFFLKSLGADEQSAELLSKMTLTVKADNGSVFFTAPANETAALSDWVELGTLHNGGSIKLTLTLKVPIELGNEFQDAIGKITWKFKSEEQPIDVEHHEKCPECGGEMTRKVIVGDDGKYYYYYECLNEHKTPPIPTGDNFNVVPYVIALGVSAFAVIVLFVIIKRNNKHKKKR